MDELTPPPAPPQMFTIEVIREDNIPWMIHNVVSFEPQENAYLALTVDLIRHIIPYHGVLEIMVMPDE